MGCTPYPAELVKRLNSCHMEISDGQVVGYGPPINPDGPEAASMIEALVKQIPSHEDRVLRMMTEDSAKIIDQRAFTRGYKAGLEAARNCLMKSKIGVR